MNAWPAKFRAAFCERMGCADRQYAAGMLRECLYDRARAVRPLIQLVNPRFFRPDLEAIERLGETDSWLGFEAELDALWFNNQMRCGWLHNGLKFRLSGQRAREIAEFLFGPAEPDAPRPSSPLESAPAAAPFAPGLPAV